MRSARLKSVPHDRYSNRPRFPCAVWVVKRLDELGTVVTGKTPATANPEFYGGDFLFVTPSDMQWNSYYVTETRSTVTERARGSHRNQFIPKDSIVFTCIGNTIGKCGIASADCLTNQQVNSIIVNGDNSPQFVYYALIQNRPMIRAIGLSGGAAQPIINKSTFSSVQIDVPDRATQDKIADILSAYDDLIENNRRRIALLEQAARELYREWFVRLRFPGHENARIVDGLPEVWERRTIADVCTSFDDGDWIETKDQGGEDFRLLQISNIGSNEFVETGNYRWITSETFRSLRCNEVLPGDILISRMPKPIGRAWFVYKQPWRMITAVDVTIARPDQTAVDPRYFLYHLNSQTHIARCELRATGATRPRISRKAMGALPIILPPMTLQLTFGQIASVSNEQRNTLMDQNKVLAQARDLLLPRLMSGEVRV